MIFYILFTEYFSLVAELEKMTGVAAILRFPMPEIEDEDNDDSDEEQ